MACHSCRRDLLRQLSSAPQRLSTPIEAEYAAIARHTSRTAAPRRQQRQPMQQRRSFQTTAAPQALIPESVKKLGGLVLKSTSEPYQVHRATQAIYKACAAQANYTISETDKRNGTVLMTEEGEQIGTGNTTWHTGTDLLSLSLLSPRLLIPIPSTPPHHTPPLALYTYHEHPS
jgi:cytochrome b pre-mRNA-processing protein 3